MSLMANRGGKRAVMGAMLRDYNSVVEWRDDSAQAVGSIPTSPTEVAVEVATISGVMS